MKPTSKQIATRIGEARETRKLTQAALAEKCGMSTARISDAERGKGSMKIATLERIADGLGVTLSYFFRT